MDLSCSRSASAEVSPSAAALTSLTSTESSIGCVIAFTFKSPRLFRKLHLPLGSGGKHGGCPFPLRALDVVNLLKVVSLVGSVFIGATGGDADQPLPRHGSRSCSTHPFVPLNHRMANGLGVPDTVVALPARSFLRALRTVSSTQRLRDLYHLP